MNLIKGLGLIAAEFIKQLGPDRFKSDLQHILRQYIVINFIKALYMPLGPLPWPFGVAVFMVAQWRGFFQLQSIIDKAGTVVANCSG